MRKIVFILILLSASLWLFGEGTTEIAEIDGNPRKYVGKSLVISGEITQVVNVPLTDYQVQTVYDRTGTLPVISSVPRSVGEGIRIEVSIVGFNTENLEDSSSHLADELAHLFRREGIMTDQEALRMAQRLSSVLARILQALDTTLLGVEKADSGTGGAPRGFSV